MSRKSLFATLFVALLLGAQFVRPKLENPGVTADLVAPAAIHDIVRRACYDCHSNQTRLLWFDRVVPAYWLVRRDVLEGRKRLNFSEFGKLPAPKQKALLFESFNHVRLGAMPPSAYLFMHPDARVSADDLAALQAYLTTLLKKPPAVSVPVAPPVTEPKRALPAAPNGIAFPVDYPTWQSISSTERFDNGSLRAVLANPRAIQAIAAGTTAPWPDGAAFAKVAWVQEVDADGIVRAGTFGHAEFMFKDRARYAKTLGWGFARWVGRELKPYGKSADFAEECAGCHRPLAKTDYVFTKAQPEGSASREALRVLGTFVDPRARTLMTLFGNQLAFEHAGDVPPRAYPDGAALKLVTWSQAEDPVWFGARVPARVESIDSLRLKGSGSSETEWSHEALARTEAPGSAGGSLQALPAADAKAAERRAFMLRQGLARMASGEP